MDGGTSLFPVVSVLLTAAIATWFDLRERRIPNWLCATAFLAGVVWHWRDGLAGAGLAAAIYGTLFLLRGVGAGDVKLMMALGALAGLMPWLTIFAFSAIAGGLHAVVLIVKGGKSAVGQQKPLAPVVLAGCLAWAIPLLSR